MVVVPAGSFLMDSPDAEEGREEDEGPVHRVTFAVPFAVGAHEVTFDEWNDLHLLRQMGRAPEKPGNVCRGSTVCLWLVLMVEPVKKFAGGSALDHPVAHFDQAVGVHASQQAGQHPLAFGQGRQL